MLGHFFEKEKKKTAGDWGPKEVVETSGDMGKRLVGKIVWQGVKP